MMQDKIEKTFEKQRPDDYQFVSYEQVDYEVSEHNPEVLYCDTKKHNFKPYDAVNFSHITGWSEMRQVSYVCHRGIRLSAPASTYNDAIMYKVTLKKDKIMTPEEFKQQVQQAKSDYENGIIEGMEGAKAKVLQAITNIIHKGGDQLIIDKDTILPYVLFHPMQNFLTAAGFECSIESCQRDGTWLRVKF